MSRGLTPAQKRGIADKLLRWLKDNDTKSWANTYLILREASSALDEEVFNLWKAFDLLLILGRIERISPNGRKGARVISYAPLTKPVPSDAVICSRANCPILKNIEKIFGGN